MMLGIAVATMAMFMTAMMPSQAKAFDTSFQGNFTLGLADLYSNDPCPPDRRQQLESRIESAVSKYIEMIPLWFVEPKHVKQIVNCLTDLLNVGLSVSAIFGLNWTALLSNILSDLINRACEAATRAVDKIVNEIQANIQLPNITANIFGNDVTLFGGSLSGGLVRGAPAGQIDVQLNTPVGTTHYTRPGIAAPN
tara:strand:- start:333 stop:917 length:585 start_codon:yes stop_codon:yes gene_type:complete